MNTPNKLTLIRVALVPLFILFLMVDIIPLNMFLALITFVLASTTDWCDGYLARKNNQITTFGKFLDPLADKILVISALICFIELGYVSSIAVVIIIAREFMVTSIRLLAVSDEGKVIAAATTGKIKTVIQMIAIISTLVLASFNSIGLLLNLNISLIANILIWISAVMTVISGAEYLIKNWDIVVKTK